MSEELKDVWLGKELERLIMEPDTVVNVTLEGGDGDGKKSVSSETGVSTAESGAVASVGDSG